MDVNNRSRLKIAIIIISLVICITDTLWAKRPLKLELIILPTSANCWAVENSIEIVKEKYGSSLEIELFFLIEKNKDGKYYSRLGEADFAELKRQVYLREKRPNKLWEYIHVRNTEIYSPIWQHAASWVSVESKELDGSNISKHLNRYLSKDIELIKRHAITEIPVILLNNEVIFEGEVGLPELDQAIKARMNKVKSKFNFELVYDPNAKQSTKQQARNYLRKYVPGINFIEHPIDTKWEVILANKPIKTLPIIITDKVFVDSFYQEYFESKETMALSNGKYYLPIPISGDSLFRQIERPGEMQVIMQSHCVFAGDFLRQLVVKKKEGKLSEQLSYPAFLIDIEETKTEQLAIEKSNSKYGFISLHGEEEIEEDVRQLVLIKYYKGKYWDYIENLYSQTNFNWEKSITKMGINQKELKRLMEREGKALLEENYSVVKEIPVSQSPTLLINGKYLVTDINRYFDKKEVKVGGACQ